MFPKSAAVASQPTVASSAHQPSSPEKVLQSFNTWRFKREQPSDTPRLLALVESTASARKPLEFVMYWGKGPRHRIADPDHHCLAFLARMASSVTDAYAPGARITLIFTDTHAALNGHAPNTIDAYGKDIQAAASAHGFGFERLSTLITALNARSNPQPDDEPSDDIMTVLEASAARWYAGPLSTRHAARHYFDQNMIERRAVEATHPHAIFVTFNNSRHRPLFPEHMPIFYMYSLRKGFAVKPWFLDENCNPATLPPSWHRPLPTVAAE